MGNNYGDLIKMARLDVGLSQNDFEYLGMTQTHISRLENEEIEITVKDSIKLSKRMNLEVKDKGIQLKYKITPYLLAGKKEDDIDRLVNNLKDNTKYCYTEIDEFLEECPDNLKEKLITRILDEVLKKDANNNIDNIKKYCKKLLYFIKDKKKIAETKLTLIGCNLKGADLAMYKEIVNMGKEIEKDIELCDEIKRAAFYYNVSLANYKIKEYDKALELIKKSKKIKNNPFENKIVNIEANIYTAEKRYIKAINMYKRLLKKKDISDDDAANAKSNIADIYNTLNENKLANQYMNEALGLVEKLSNDYKFNIYYVKLQIEIKQNLNIDDTLKNALLYSNKIKEKIKKEKIIEMAINYYDGDYAKLLKMLNILNDFKIHTKSSYIVDVFPYLVNDDVCKIINGIPRY